MSSLEITTTQLFSRAALGNLWNNRTELDIATQSILDSLYRNRKKGVLQGTQQMTYKLSRSRAGQLGFGRLYGTKSSLEHLQNECRATLCQGLYHDIDIVNAQPTLLSQLAKKKLERDMPQLDLYIDNRDEILRGIMEANECTRDEAKDEVIRILYGGTTKLPALIPFSEEVRRIAKQLSRLPEYSELFEALKHEKNHYGSFLAYITQTAERECMLAMRERLMELGWSVDVLAYDGVMIRCRAGHAITPELLDDVSTAIEAATDYRVRILEKPLTAFEDIDEATVSEATDIAEGVSLEAFNDMMARFEETGFIYEGKICVYDKERALITQYTKEEAMMVLSNWRFPSRNGRMMDDKLFLPLWLNHGAKRIIKEIRMGPPSDDPAVLCLPFKPLFQDYEVAANPAAVEMFQDFLTKLVPDEPMKQLLVEWLAHIVQKPFDNSKTCIVLAGGKGCGKDTLGDFIGDWVLGGRYYTNYDSTDQFWNSYDTGRFGKMLVKLEEAQGSLNRQYEAAFKARVTAESMTVNPKGKKAMTMPNYARYLLTTNEASPVKVDEQERRFAIIHCGCELINNMVYWRQLRSVLFCESGAKAVGEWLMTQPIGEFPRVLMKSELHTAMIDMEKTSEEQFLVESGSWEKEEMSATELYREYKMWATAIGINATPTLSWFGRNMGQLFLDGKVRRRMLNGKSLYRRVFGGAGSAETLEARHRPTALDAETLEARHRPTALDAE